MSSAEPIHDEPPALTFTQRRRLSWLEREHGETQEMLQRVLAMLDAEQAHDAIALEVAPFVRPF